MVCCPSCGGIIGRECWKPQECAWITQQMVANAAVQESEYRRQADEYGREMARQQGEQMQREWYEHIGFDPVSLGM